MADDSEILLGKTEEGENDGGGVAVAVVDERKVNTRKIPVGAWVLEKLGLCNLSPRKRYMPSNIAGGVGRFRLLIWD